MTILKAPNAAVNIAYANMTTGRFFQKHFQIWLGPQAHIDFNLHIAKPLFEYMEYEERTYKKAISWFDKVTYGT